KESIGQLAQTTLRAEIGRMNLDDTLSGREEMNASLLKALDEASADWGTKVIRVEVKNIEVPKDVEDAMILQMKAVRERRALEERASGEKTAAIRRSEGELEAKNNEAQAIERMAIARKAEEVL